MYSKIRSWWKLELLIPFELEETLAWKLEKLGINSFAFQHAPDRPFEKALVAWLPSNEWTRSNRERLEDCFKPLALTFGVTLLPAKWEEINDEDWSLSWKKHWKPDPVGQKLLVLPAWLETPAQYSNRTVIRLDPGSAFGSGSHPTTRLCLKALEKFCLTGLTVADLGCGSGILSLAAMRLGARKVLAVDIDSLAIISTVQNSHLNSIDQVDLKVALGSIDELEEALEGKWVDLLVCNTLAPVIKKVAPSFSKVIGPKGSALLSGLLVDQVPEIKSILASLGWQVVHEIQEENWGLLEIRR